MNNNENIISGDLRLNFYSSRSFSSILETEIKELYTIEETIDDKIKNLFDEYNNISEFMVQTGSDYSFQSLLLLINNDTDGNGIIYSDDILNITFNDIQSLIDISSSYSDLIQEMESGSQEDENLEDINIISADNLNFEEWDENNNLKIWDRPYTINLLPVAGSSDDSNTAIRIRYTNVNGGSLLYNKDIRVNYQENIEIKFKARTSGNGFKVTVCDKRGGFYDSWWKTFVGPNTFGEWQEFSFNFTPGINPNGNFPGVAMSILLYPSNQNVVNEWTEFDDIKLTRLRGESGGTGTNYAG